MMWRSSRTNRELVRVWSKGGELGQLQKLVCVVLGEVGVDHVKKIGIK